MGRIVTMATPMITVSLWETTIGYLGYAPGETRVATFEFHPAFSNSGIELSPIVMKSMSSVHSFPYISDHTFHGLPGIFADSLPDKFGNKLIDHYFAGKGMSSSEITALDRLAYIGKRGMGAFEYTPDINGESVMGGGALDIHMLAELSDMVLKRDESFKKKLEDASTHKEALAIIKIGSSAGGARSKALVSQDKKGKLYDGTVDMGSNKQYWLLKFDSAGNKDKEDKADPRGMTKVEYIYSHFASALGIEMPNTKYILDGDHFHFMIERFDREIINNKVAKKHYSSWAGLSHFDREFTGVYSYEQLLLTARELNVGFDSIEQIYKRAIFNIVGRNQDDHTKNFGFIMDKNGNWTLSPAFDMTFSYDPTGKWTKEHQISLSGVRDGFTQAHLLEFASKCGIKQEKAISIIQQTVEQFSTFKVKAKEFDLDVELMEFVSNNLRTIFK